MFQKTLKYRAQERVPTLLLRTLGLILLMAAWKAGYAEPWRCGTPLLIARGYDDSIRGDTRELAPTAPAAPALLGQIDRFFIHIPETSVTATCVAIGQYCYIYVENSVRAMMTDAEATTITKTFDTQIYPKVRHWMGAETQPGLDRDNRITILMHDVGMNASGRDYGGYFAPVDLQPTLPNSNRRDILFMDIFQFKERARQTFYSSLAHEFAHLVNWYQNGGTVDQRWLEEGIASLVEWGVYGTIHTLFVDNYLANPNVSLTTANTLDVYYGAAFMLLLYLYENYGGITFIRDLAAEDVLGQHAIDITLGEDTRFTDTFLDWGLANYLNNPVHGQQMSYRNLPNRKIRAVPERVSNYPKRRANIPITNWETHYTVFQNLPETLELTLHTSTTLPLYAKVAYLPSNRFPATVTAVPRVSSPHHIGVPVAEQPYTCRVVLGSTEGLNRDGKIVLIVTSPYPQTFSYAATLPGEVENVVESLLPPDTEKLLPDAVTYAFENATVSNNFQQDIASARVKPLSQIHLASNYQDIVIHGDIAYVGSDWGLEIFALTPVPRRVGEIATPGNAQAVAFRDGTVYIADGAAGIHLIDVNLPTQPRYLKTLGGFQDARRVQVDNGKLYTVGTQRGLWVFDEKDTHAMQTPRPRQIWTVAGTPEHLVVKDDIVYLSDNRQGFQILTTNPLGGFSTMGTVPVVSLDFQIGPRYAYIATGEFQIVDIRDPSAPEPVSRLNTPGRVSGVLFDAGRVYLADEQAGLHIVDVRTPHTPRLVASQFTSGNATKAALYKPTDTTTYAYIIAGAGGIQTIDVTVPHAPNWIHRYDAGNTPYGLDILTDSADKTTVALANGIAGLKIVEFNSAEPTKSSVTQHIPLTVPPQNRPARALSVRGVDNIAYVGTESGMHIINLDTGNRIAYIPTATPVYDVALIDRYVYLCATRLIVVDTGQNYRIVSQRNVQGSAYRIAVSAPYTYVAALEGGVHVFDITDPATPQLVANNFATEGIVTNITLANDRAYVLDGLRNSVSTYDISNPREPIPGAEYVDTHLPIDAAVRGNTLYLLDSESLQLLNGHTLQRLSRFSQLRFPFALSLTGDSDVYVSDLYELRSFRTHLQATNLAVEQPLISNSKDGKPVLSIGKYENRLLQNFPNPFNPETWIPYSLSEATAVTLSIYDVRGHCVYHHLLGHQKVGEHTTYWDGRNAIGEQVANGIYFYQLSTPNFTATRKMLIQR